MALFARVIIGVFDCDQSVQPEASVDRVPALVHRRTDGQMLQMEMLEQLADHLRWQVFDAGW